MKALLTLFGLIVCAAVVLAVPGLVAPYSAQYGTVTIFDTGKAVLLCIVLAVIAGYIASKQGANGAFLLKLFVAALLVRILVAAAIFVFNGQEFFGGDAVSYDFVGYAQFKVWNGDGFYQSVVDRFVGRGAYSAWGMVYLVAVVYEIIGRNMLSIQLVNAVLGAATAVVIFLCAYQVFNNLRVARLAAIAVAFYPSLVLWSSQGLKDAPIVFFLALSIFATLKLGEKLMLKYLVLLVFSLFALLSLRFYVFYMIAFAVGGAFIIGMQSVSATNFVRQFMVILILGLSLTYLGVSKYANTQVEIFGNLQRVQRSRSDASTSANSGFASDVDVSTTSGAVGSIPIGLLYLLFAPFPWQLTSLRQSITLPEMIVWWASFPMMILGLWFSIRYRLRQISPVLIFTGILSIAYSIIQGNVGTAYRQRSQLLVFYFIFTAVGYVLLREKGEDRKRRRLAEEETLGSTIPASLLL